MIVHRKKDKFHTNDHTLRSALRRVTIFCHINWIIIKMKLAQSLLRKRYITTKIVKEINRCRKVIYVEDEMISGPFFWNFYDKVQYFHIRSMW